MRVTHQEQLPRKRPTEHVLLFFPVVDFFWQFMRCQGLTTYRYPY
jgi:hypothetical protein